MEVSCYVCSHHQGSARANTMRPGAVNNPQRGIMRTRTFRATALSVLAAFSLVAAACGGDDDDDDAGGAATSGDGTAATATSRQATTAGETTAVEGSAPATTTGGTAPEGTAAPTAPPRGDADLVIWSDDTRQAVVKESPTCSARRTGSRSRCRRCRARVRAQFNLTAPTGEGPDIVVGANDWIGELSTNGVLEPITIPNPDDFARGRRSRRSPTTARSTGSRTRSRTSP